jgi:hypothetical protein
LYLGNVDLSKFKLFDMMKRKKIDNVRASMITIVGALLT